MPELIETFTRPNGKPYKPRSPKLVAHAWENYDDCRSGVIILGTLNPERAHDFAVQMCRYWYGCKLAVNPEPGWFRDGFYQGDRTWLDDSVRGRPGVQFTAEDD